MVHKMLWHNIPENKSLLDFFTHITLHTGPMAFTSHLKYEAILVECLVL